LTTDAFWSSRPVLQHVLTLARARRVGPWAVLANAVASAVATIPPRVTLPPIVGGRGSLNMCVAVTGPSGAGKGTAAAAAREGFHYTDAGVLSVPIGTGEGIARTYRPAGTPDDADNPITSATFTAEEIDTWAALSGRTGSTLSAEVRKLYSGEQLGFGNAGKDTRNIVAAHTYRASVIVGVQPERSGPLLHAADGGLPQRFWWVPTGDPDAPDEPPDDPKPWQVTRPAWDRHLSAVGGTAHRHQELVVPDAARDRIIRARQAVLREEPGADPLAAHSLLTRLKIAAGLMALDGRTVVNDEDWKLAGYIMDVSDWTRERCRRALDDVHRRTNTARALATAEREEIISDRKLQRCKDGIIRALSGQPADRLTPHNQLRRSLKSDLRDYFDAATTELIAEGRITAGRTPKGIGYAGPPVDHMRPRTRQRTRGNNRTAQQTDEHAS
jgi:hypothetical protein